MSVHDRGELRRATAGTVGATGAAARVPDVLVVSRFRVPEDELDVFRADVHAALAVLTARPGCLDGLVGRNVDDPSLWVVTTRWRDVGSYRRALSAYDVKVGAVPLLSRAVDEPSAYEIDDDSSRLNTARPRGL
jgi:quinol monooxygenase YgiN